MLYQLQEKRRGFFVEFGAQDGVELSNTYLLEKGYEWNGILAEPSRLWPEVLKKNRHCALDFRCVWTMSNTQIEFLQAPEDGLSTISKFADIDAHAPERKDGIKYLVEAVSLNDLLKQHNAPTTIDYISVDTEGSEYDILSAFDFNAFDVRIFSIEHNYTDTREKILSLMTSKGYVRKFDLLSGPDDWYVKKSDAPTV